MENVETMQQSKEEIQAKVLECLGSVIGDDTVAVLKVTDSTRLFTDLQLGSIEVVSLVEALGKHYPLGDEFFDWVSTMSYASMGRMTIGDVVDFIDHAQH